MHADQTANPWPIDASKHETTGSALGKDARPTLETSQLSSIESSTWWQRLSVRTKAVFLAMTIGTFPILLVGTTTYLVTNESIRQQVLQTEETNALDLEGKLNSFINERYNNIQSFALLNLFADSKLRYTVSLAEKQKVLDQYVRSSKFGDLIIYDSVVVADLDGNVLAKSKEDAQSPQAAKIFDRDYFQAVLKTDKAVIGYPQVSQSSKKYSIFAAAPIKDSETGKTVAIIRARIPLSDLKSVFGKSASQGDAFFLKDAEGEIITATDSSLLQKKLMSEFPLISLQNDQKQTTIAAPCPRQNPRGDHLSSQPDAF